MDDDLECFECITLEKETDSFVDDDGMYKFKDGVWYELFTTVSSAQVVVIH